MVIEIRADRTVWLDGVRVHLTSSLTSILELLLALRGRIVTREELMDKLYGLNDNAPKQKILDVFICKMRKAGIPIVTEWGRGWSLPGEGEVAA